MFYVIKNVLAYCTVIDLFIKLNVYSLLALDDKYLSLHKTN